MLARFHRLQALRITGDASCVDWRAPGAAAVLPKLRALSLGPWRVPFYEIDDPLAFFDLPRHAVCPDALPAGMAAALAAATALDRLSLRVCWSDEVPALVRALPALRGLELEIFECSSQHAEAAATLMAQLPGVEASLSFHAFEARIADLLRPMTDCKLPPLASTAAAITELRLTNHRATLPPDWRQLATLRSLHLVDVFTDWGSEPLTALTALSEVRFGRYKPPPPALLATAPALACVHAHAIAGERDDSGARR